jgi:hypothetical protein
MGNRPVVKRALSEAEESFAISIRAFKHPEPVREFVFLPDRKFRFDFAWPDQMVALEVEGGIYGGKKTSGKSRHTTIGGFEGDCIKYALAAAAGWRVYRFSSGQVMKGIALLHMENEFEKWRTNGT